ncbi:MAG: serine/threonine protein kinase [Microcystaceae cyanobacterium]
MSWTTGHSLQGGRYVIDGVIGKGRFGITYRVKKAPTDHFVVIKTLNDQGLDSAEFERLQELFVQEAVKLAQCDHPHIVKAKTPFQEDGKWCIEMEYIDGITLDKRGQSILSEAEALNYIKQIGEALIEVHGHNFLHRDVRPGNIMIRAGKPEAVLIDFGLALEFDHPLSRTRTEEVMEGYAALELYSSRTNKGIYTDIYSLGATLYNLLTGQIPVSASKRKLYEINKVDGAELVAPNSFNPQISEQTNQAILKAMELEAINRPSTVQDWLKALDSQPSDSQSEVESNQALDSNSSNSKWDWQTLAAVIAAVGGLLAGIAAIIALFINKEPTPQSSPSPTPSSQPSSPTSSPKP